MATRAAIEELGRQFTQSPFDFFTESDLQSELYHILKNALDETNHDPLNPRSSVFESMSLSVGSTTSHRDQFDSWLKERADDLASSKSGVHLSRVHTEVWYTTDFGTDRKNRVDIALIRGGDPANYRPLSWVNGKQTISFEMIDTAIEVKYLRERLYLDTRVNEVDPSSASVEEIVDHLDIGFSGIKKDLDRLERIAGNGSEGYTDLEAYFLLFTNYDPLRRFRQSQDRLPRSMVNEKIGYAFQKKIEDEYPAVEVYYGSPADSTWLC